MQQPRGLDRRGFLGTLTAGTVGAVAGCLGSSATLEMGIVPDVDPDTAIARNEGLATYLEGELDAEIDLRTTTDYAGLVQAMASEQLDFAYFGGVSYVLARRRADAEPIVVGSRDGTTEWESVFVVDDADRLPDMETVAAEASSVSLAFGDPISTSGTVMPTYYLDREYDLDPEREFGSLTHVGAHDAVIGAVNGESADVGALNARIYDSLSEERDEMPTEIWRTPSFADYPWAVAPSMADDRTASLRDAFLGLDREENADVLEQQNVDHYVEIDHAAFAEIEDAVELIGIDDVSRE